MQPKIRKAFPDTAFWAADLVTDTAGKAQAKVEFPDSLTTWRATARGVATDAQVGTRVGAAITKTIVRKNLILRLAVPRFFVQGDEIMISALVHNYLATEKTVRVSLDFKGLDVLDGATRDVHVLPRTEVRLDWRVRAQQVRNAVDHRQGAHRRRERRAGTGTPGQHSRREAESGARRIAGCRRQRGVRPHVPREGAARIARCSAFASRLRSPVRSSARWITSLPSLTAAWNRRCRASCRISWSRRR